MIIDGKNVTSQRAFDVVNPYTREKVGTVPLATPEHVQQALKLSYETRSRLSSSERSITLKDIASRLQKQKKDFAALITAESGLCIKDTMHEVDRAAEAAICSAKVAEIIENDTTNDYLLGSKKQKPELRVVTEPWDLVVAITPFNHPLNQVAHKVFPAIAAGACVVLKPSLKTPLTAIKLGHLLLKAGLEKNMLNIITGVPACEVTDQMVTSPLVDMVTFTGSLQTGRYIKNKMCESGNTFKKFVPELGGCSSLIINDDADIARSVKEALRGCFKNSGQRCTAIRRIIVLNSIANEFVDAFLEEARSITYGNPYDENVDMGTVISEDAAKIFEQRVSDSVKDGAKLLLGNKREGSLYSPTILDYVNINSELVAKETFAPIAPIIRTDNIDDAISLANKTNYRLAGGIMTKKREIAERVSRALVVGQFNWNGFPSYRTEAAPFGGFKDSGSGEKEGTVLAAFGMRRIRTFYEH